MSYPQEETKDDGFFPFFLCLIVLALAFPVAKHAMARHNENNYLKNNQCKIDSYSVKDISGYKTLWSCNNVKYISEQVSY